MIFSIIIPSYNNLDYLKVCLESLNKNSEFNHEIIVHINEGSDGTKKYIEENKINHTYSKTNIGLCSAVNIAARESKNDFILYSHDDMYFLPGWDSALIEEIEKIPDRKFLLSSIQISHNGPGPRGIEHIEYNAGENLDNFDEKKLLENYKKLSFHDLQGSHWAPHIISKDIWNDIGGFSEEFNPGFGSDPDLNMKMWNIGIRIFKGVNKSRVYHFGSQTTRKNKEIIRNNANRTFLLKWGITIEFFVKFYLNRGETYKKKLDDFKLSFQNFIPFIFCKIRFFITKLLLN